MDMGMVEVMMGEMGGEVIEGDEEIKDEMEEIEEI